MSLDDWEIDEQRLVDSGAPGTRALPVTLLGSTFTRRDAISAVARAFDVTPDEAAALTARFLEREGVVRVLADPGAGTEHIRTRSGHVVPATSGDRRYTTTELLAAEQRIIGSATAAHRRRNRPGRPRHGRPRPRTATPTSTANRPTVCGRCSPRATATTW